MNLKRTVIFGAGGAALVAIIAGASTPGRRAIAPPSPAKPARADLRGAELATEITRLRERLRPSTEPRTPSRNLFRYRASTSADAVAPPPLVDAAPAPALPLRPSLALVGIAEDPGPEGAVRTAILMVGSEMLLVKVGDKATARFRVVSISTAAVELTDAESNTTFQVASK